MKTRNFTFIYETKNDKGSIVVNAESYSAAISAMKKQVRGIKYFKSID